MNEEYIDHKSDDYDISASPDGRVNMDYTPDIHPVPDLIEWRPKFSRNVSLTTEAPFELLLNLNRPVHYKLVINGSEDESIMVEITSTEGQD